MILLGAIGIFPNGGDGYTQEPSVPCSFRRVPLPDFANNTLQVPCEPVLRVFPDKVLFDRDLAKALHQVWPQN